MTVPLDLSLIAKYRNDFLALMGNIKKVSNYDSAFSLRKSITSWKNALEEFIFRDLIPTLHEEVRAGNLRKDWADYKEGEVRKALWALVVSSLPIELDDKYYSKEMRFNQFLKDVKTFESRERKKAREAWEVLKDFVEWYSNSTDGKTFAVDVPEEENLKLAGFSVTIITPAGWRKNKKEEVQRIEEGLRRLRQRANSICPELLKRDLPLVISYKDREELSSAGRYEGTKITIMGWYLNKVEDVVSITSHEFGHHLWGFLGKRETDFWEKMISGDWGTFDLRDVVKRYGPKDSWLRANSKIAKEDPYLYYQLGGLNSNPYVPRDLKNAGDVGDLIEYLDKGGDPIIRMQVHPVSSYGNKNAQEAFCETLSLLITYGPMTVGEQTKSWMKEIVPSLKMASIRSGSLSQKQGDGVMNKAKAASQLVELASRNVRMASYMMAVAEDVAASDESEDRENCAGCKMASSIVEMANGRTKSAHDLLAMASTMVAEEVEEIDEEPVACNAKVASQLVALAKEMMAEDESEREGQEEEMEEQSEEDGDSEIAAALMSLANCLNPDKE